VSVQARRASLEPVLALQELVLEQTGRRSPEREQALAWRVPEPQEPVPELPALA
jgi:hypothetical protein